jgi:hypothetical protein
MTGRNAALLALTLGLTLVACIAGVEPDVGDLRAGVCKPVDSDPSVDVSFKHDIQPLLQRPFGQAGCSCHIPSGKKASGFEATGLNLTTYSGLMHGGNASRDTVVIAGDPCSSLIVQKTSDAPPTGSRMPSDGPPYLTPSERQLLNDWITEGARDN